MMTNVGLLLLKTVPIAIGCVIILTAPIWVPYVIYERVRYGQ